MTGRYNTRISGFRYVGFVRDRQTQENIRQVLHVIDHITKKNSNALGISLDAEKAFDSC